MIDRYVAVANISGTKTHISIMQTRRLAPSARNIECVAGDVNQ